MVDTREQLPLFPHGVDGLEIIRKKLDHGDYSIKGFEKYFAIERKMMSDFYSYIGKERKRTVRKMEEFENMIDNGGFVGLAVEASEDEVFMGFGYSKVSPEAARQSLATFRVRYGVHTYLANDRESIERWTLDNAIKFFNTRREVK